MYPGFQRGGGGGGGGCLRSGPIQKVWGGGGGASGPIYEKWGGGALQVRYTGGGGGGGPFRFRSDTFGHTENILHVPTYVLPRYTSHARTNERKIHTGKG